MKTFNSILAFQKEFGTDEQCRKHLELSRWGNTPACPYCGSTNVHRFPNGRKFGCKEKQCRLNFSVTVGTIYENTKIPLNKWYLATYILVNHSKGISSAQLANWLDVTQRTAWFLTHRIREMLKDKAAEQLGNMVEADETYIGGRESNNNQSRYQKRLKHEAKKAGTHKGTQGGAGKTIVAGMVERGGKVVTKVVPNTTGETLKGFILETVKQGSTIYTDENKSYHGLDNWLYKHDSVQHSTFEYVRGDVHVNTLEGFWSLLKRQIVGIHHSVSPQHLQRYCNESAWRYNNRGTTQDVKFNEAIKASENARLKYDVLIGKRIA